MPSQDPLIYEKALLDDWIAREFGEPGAPVR